MHDRLDYHSVNGEINSTLFENERHAMWVYHFIFNIIFLSMYLFIMRAYVYEGTNYVQPYAKLWNKNWSMSSWVNGFIAQINVLNDNNNYVLIDLFHNVIISLILKNYNTQKFVSNLIFLKSGVNILA